MSLGYADRLSDSGYKGVLDLKSKPDPIEAAFSKGAYLSSLLSRDGHVVVHTGAGISTSAGIADFRGPNGIWTLKKKGKDLEKGTSFELAQPTLTHMALVALYQEGFIKYVVSQNVDGLHGRSGLVRSGYSELHGNVFGEKCKECGKEYVREYLVDSVGLKETGRVCGDCGGFLVDTCLDWDDRLPEKDEADAYVHCDKATVSICLGTSMQMNPARLIPFRNNAFVAILNLSPTEMDSRADMVIREKSDLLMAFVTKFCNIGIPLYKREARLNLTVSFDEQNNLTCFIHSISDDGSDVARLPYFSDVRYTLSIKGEAYTRVSARTGDAFSPVVFDTSDVEYLQSAKVVGLKVELSLTESLSGIPRREEICYEIVVAERTFKQECVVELQRMNYEKLRDQMVLKAMEEMELGDGSSISDVEVPSVWFWKHRAKKRYVVCARCESVVHCGQKSKHLEKCMRKRRKRFPIEKLPSGKKARHGKSPFE